MARSWLNSRLSSDSAGDRSLGPWTGGRLSALQAFLQEASRDGPSALCSTSGRETAPSARRHRLVVSTNLNHHFRLLLLPTNAHESASVICSHGLRGPSLSQSAASNAAGGVGEYGSVDMEKTAGKENVQAIKSSDRKEHKSRKSG